MAKLATKNNENFSKEYKYSLDFCVQNQISKCVRKQALCKNHNNLSIEDQIKLIKIYQTSLIVDNNNYFLIKTNIPLIDLKYYGKEALSLLVNQFYGLSVFHAKRYLGHGVDFLDLVQIGLATIVDTLKIYDCSLEKSPSSLISGRIRNKLYRSIALYGYSVKVPERIHKCVYNYKIAEQELCAEEGYKPSRNDVLKKINISEIEMTNIEKYTKMIYIDAFLYNNDGEGCSLSERIPEKQYNEAVSIGRTKGQEIVSRTSTQEKELEDKESEAEIMRMINSLPNEMSTAIKMKFGFDDGECKTYEEIALVLNTYKMKVKRLICEGLNKLRVSMKELNVNEYLNL